MRSAIERRPLMLILVSLPSFLRRQAATISSGSSSRVSQNSFRSAARDGSSCGSTPDCSRSPVNQVLTELYSSSGLLIDAILLGQSEHARERPDFFLAPRQRRRRLDHLGRPHLLGHLGIGLEGLAVLALEENFLDGRARTLTTRFPRFRWITDQQHPQREPFGRRLEDLVHVFMLKRRETNAEALIDRGQHRLTNRDARVGGGRGGDRGLI